MSLTNILKTILNIRKKIDIKKLPSMGLFYNNDFEIWIKKADMSDIIEYEYQFRRDDLGSILYKLKKVVEKNTDFSSGYTFKDIRSIDVIFLFVEIVKFTNNKPFLIYYNSPISGKKESIDFSSETFNYFDISSVKDNYDSISKDIQVDGFKYKLPTIGIENSITNFLLSKSNDPKNHMYQEYSYDFMYFLGDRHELNQSEIENLIHIFNTDMSPEEAQKIRNIVETYSFLGKYSLKKDGVIVELSSNIDLEKVWK